jgi:hypothetical protein
MLILSSKGNLGKILPEIPKHPLLIEDGFLHGSRFALDQILDLLQIAKIPHIINDSQLKPIPIQIVVFFILNLNHQN